MDRGLRSRDHAHQRIPIALPRIGMMLRRVRPLLLAVVTLATACTPVRWGLGLARRLGRDTTALAGGAVLVGAGDIGLCFLPGAEATSDLLDQIPGTVFTAGDNAYPDGSAADFRDCYDRTWGRHRARTYPSPGNHEYEQRDGAPYFAYFGARAGQPGLGYYSYDLGAWHVVSLNSNIDVGASSPQQRWLRADLEAHPAHCTAVYFHHARFSSSRDAVPRMRALWLTLYSADADIVISGHHHAYERFAPQTPDGRRDDQRGIRQFVVGTGGAGLDYFGRTAHNSEKRYNANYGVLKLMLFNGWYRWEFISANGNVRDRGRGQCH